MREIFFLLVITLFSCAKVDFSLLDQRMKDDHLSLITTEHHVLESYFTLQEFHNDLLTECQEKDSTPYPELVLYLEQMRLVMNKMTASRARFYNANQNTRKVLETSLRRGKKIPELTFTDLKIRLDAYIDSALKYDAEFRVIEEKYRFLIDIHEIAFISHSSFAEYLVGRITSWEDSLKMQNLSVAQAREKLNRQGWDKRGNRYRSAYLPLSDMEFGRKELLSKLTGLNNAHNRYEVARPEEGFYVGPYIVPRHDVLMVEDVFPQIDSIMQVFRINEKRFYSGIN